MQQRRNLQKSAGGKKLLRSNPETMERVIPSS
jgi:hypothetical protein